MPKYQRKPKIVEAWQWTGKTLEDTKEFCEKNGLPKFHIGSRWCKTGLVVDCRIRVAEPGDYIVKQKNGQYIAQGKEEFEEKFELIDEQNQQNNECCHYNSEKGVFDSKQKTPGIDTTCQRHKICESAGIPSCFCCLDYEPSKREINRIKGTITVLIKDD